jgi:hypothetical protein
MENAPEPIWLSRDGKTEGPFTQAQIDELQTNGILKNYAWIWRSAAQGWIPLNVTPPPPAPEGAIVTATANIGNEIEIGLDHGPATTSESAATGTVSEHNPETAIAETPITMEAQSTAEAQSSADAHLTGDTTATADTPVTEEPLTTAAAPMTTSAPDEAASASVVPLSERVSLFAAICHDNRNVIGGMLTRQGNIGTLISKDYAEARSPFRKGHKVHLNLLDESSGSTENLQAEIEDLKKSPEGWEYTVRWAGMPLPHA